VTGVDVSDEMIRQARRNTADLENIDLLVGDGCTLSSLANAGYDFAFSFIVFQHIPSYEVMASYCREVYRILKPGGLFKFQVQGSADIPKTKLDTWIGYPISPREAVTLAEESGFDIEREDGAGTQYYWLWFRKVA
jgi:ubiquinone/menaquinone biosynthesis C-methylase UbiE